MTDNVFQHFTDNYISSGFNKIKFDRNGECGNKFFYKNYEFRVQLCQFLLPQLDTVKIDLIRDLYLKTGRFSKATFGVYNIFHLFTQQLLRRSGIDYLLNYMEGASHTMNTGMASGRITFTKERVEELLRFFDRRKREITDPKKQRLLNDFIRQRLKFHANK